MLVVSDLLGQVLDVLVELVPLRRELLDLRLQVREGLLLLPRIAPRNPSPSAHRKYAVEE